MTEFKVGDRVEYVGIMSKTLVGKNGTVGSFDGGPSDSNVPVTWDDVSIMCPGVFPMNLNLIEDPKFVPLGEAWRVGNVVEFTVDASFDDGMYQVGCQKATPAEAQPFIQSYKKLEDEKVQLTIRGEIKHFDCGSRDCCSYVGFKEAGVEIAYSEAEAYLRDFRIISNPEPVKAPEPVVEEPGVTLVMTALQSRALYGLLGKFKGGSDLGDLWVRLDAATGIMDFGYDVISNDGENLESLTLVKKVDPRNPF